MAERIHLGSSAGGAAGTTSRTSHGAPLCVSSKPRPGRGDWSPAEEEILRRHYKSKGAAYTAKLLDDRSMSAIYAKCIRMGLQSPSPVNPASGWMSATEVVKQLGITPKTLDHWIDTRGLPTKLDGNDGALRISAPGLRRWIQANHDLIDLKKVSKAWFITLLVNKKAPQSS